MSKVHHGRAWRNKSLSYLKGHIFCEIWLSLGRSVRADHTDHIVRIEERGAIWLDSNLMALSEFWHNRKSKLEQTKMTLGLDYEETLHGKIPKDRNQVIEILKKHYWRDILDYKDGFRT